MSNISTFKLELDKESLSEVVDNINLRVDVALDELTEEVEWQWRMLASRSTELKSTKEKYLDAIEVKREGDEIILSLTDPLAASMEAGSGPYDLKPGFLRGKQFRIIPLVSPGTDNVTGFRTLTQGSAGWVHPGHKARKIVDQVTAELEATVVVEVLAKVFSRTKI